MLRQELCPAIVEFSNSIMTVILLQTLGDVHKGTCYIICDVAKPHPSMRYHFKGYKMIRPLTLPRGYRIWTLGSVRSQQR